MTNPFIIDKSGTMDIESYQSFCKQIEDTKKELQKDILQQNKTLQRISAITFAPHHRESTTKKSPTVTPKTH